MAALFGELGANAIHKIAEANGWKDGSPEKIAMHAALAAVNAEIVKGNITAAAITGGSTEALSNAILKAVGEAKGSSASDQWAAAVVGAALSSATGGDAQSSASIAANAIKNNHLDEELIAQNSKAGSLEYMKAILEANQKVYDYDKTFSPEQQKVFENLETNGATNVLIYETFDLLVDKQIIDDPRNISKGMDYRVYKITMPIKNIPVTLAVIADRYGNVYSAGEISSPGFTGASFSVSYY